ncbi:MAG: GerMN domain-containing protein [Negativicutes bacterium]|jgi:spore germination protein GerM
MKKLLVLCVIVSTLLVAGCFSDSAKNVDNRTVKPTSEQVVLYFATKDLTKVVAEKREITHDNRAMQSAVDLLIAGSKRDGAQSLFPQGVKCLGVKIVNGVAIVDFNDALKAVKSQLGSSGQMLLVASLANTLTEFNGVNAIRIAVNGKLLEVLGEIDLSEPIGRTDDLIEK